MGFKVEVNNMIRTDDCLNPEVGKKYKFEKSGSRILPHDIQSWLLKEDWTALAEIQVTSQTREGDKTYGEFEVLHVLDEQEREVLTKVFRRMYGW